ncbi:hypothetical protein INT44_003757 [Umbelopsis vinacea]|uniref:HIT domain-containing protein n=1 Tax=Umbelopsis vinacea TaxID=44442 RepID=A0A8H7PVY3_9FUNG|nr:hypothetical protein INT44_003757 [Umbelopsis vinacea]
MSASHLSDNCLFCKIIRGEIPSQKIAETDKSYAFLDIMPLSEGHAVSTPRALLALGRTMTYISSDI